MSHYTLPNKEVIYHDSLGMKGEWIITKREAPWITIEQWLKFLPKHLAHRLAIWSDKVMNRFNWSEKFSNWICEVKSEIRYKNVVPNVGKNALAAQMAGTNTYEAQVTYIATGTGAGTPAAGDTILFTELTRNALSTGTQASNVATLKAFFNSAQSNGTLTEMGAFGDGSASQATASSGTGILYSHVSISEVKTSSETLTCQFTITFS